MVSLLQDLRYALRTFLKNPGLVAVAIVTLALGIGANTIIFSVVDSVLLRPLPLGQPDRIVYLYTTNRIQGGRDIFSPANFLDIERQSRTLEAVAAWDVRGFDMTGAGDPRNLPAARVTPGFLQAVGVAPAMGRDFSSGDDLTGSERVVILSHALWRDLYGADPGILGRSIQLSGEPWTVIGVMPPGFDFPAGVQVWAPSGLDEEQRRMRGAIFLEALGRLAPGQTIEAARAELGVIAGGLERDYPQANAGTGLGIEPLHTRIVGDARRPLLVLLAAVAFVLLVGCANLANLLLASASARYREFALRAALGASRGRLVRQLLTECVLLSLLGGAGGTLVALWGISALPVFGPGDVPRLDEAALDWRILLFTFLVSVATGLLFGLAPALAATRTDLHGALKEGARGAGTGAAAGRLRAALVVSEVALVMVLLAGAGLMIRSFLRLRAVDPGFQADRLVSLQVFLPDSRYPTAASRAAFHDALIERLGSVPGVARAAASHPGPVGMIPIVNDANFRIDGRPEPSPGDEPLALLNRAGPGWFSAMRIPLSRGREFTDRDRDGAPLVAVINETMARRFWPGEDPIGRRIILGSRQPVALEIVGVAADVAHLRLDSDTRPTFYVPLLQRPSGALNVAIRTAAPAPEMIGAIRAALWSVDRDLPADYLDDAEAILSRSLSRPRFTMLLMAGFAGLALLLAMVGLYGVIAFSVSRRTQEIGVRMALGASSRDVFRMVLRQALGLTALGALIGLAASAGLTRLLSGLLFQVSATDPVTYAWVLLLLCLVAALASWLPARRATRVDPIIALRCE